MDERFSHDTYLVRKKIFKLLGDAFHIYGPGGELLFYSRLKAFKLKEDIRLFTGEDMREEVLRISARSILDFGATYDVVDSATGERLGALRRKGLKALLQDEWLILDAADRELGLVREDHLVLALARRFLPLADMIPQAYTTSVGGQEVLTIKQHFNPFVMKVTLEFHDPASRLDRRLGIVAGILMCAIEGHQG